MQNIGTYVAFWNSGILSKWSYSSLSFIFSSTNSRVHCDKCHEQLYLSLTVTMIVLESSNEILSTMFLMINYLGFECTFEMEYRPNWKFLHRNKWVSLFFATERITKNKHNQYDTASICLTQCTLSECIRTQAIVTVECSRNVSGTTGLVEFRGNETECNQIQCHGLSSSQSLRDIDTERKGERGRIGSMWLNPVIRVLPLSLHTISSSVGFGNVLAVPHHTPHPHHRGGIGRAFQREITIRDTVTNLPVWVTVDDGE